ncbi:MAG TPA: hypothetical protein VHF26_22880, partial [Trebonia sp.]|nr:hypothetical protein [Trebonia sp.]
MTAALSRRRLLVVSATLVAAAVAVALGIGLSRPGDSPGVARPPLTGPASAAGIARLHAIQHLLAARSAAVLRRDRAAFMASVDPRAKWFRRTQARLFAHLAPVPLAAWSYDLTALARRAPPDASRYGAPTWAPEFFALRYRL